MDNKIVALIGVIVVAVAALVFFFVHSRGAAAGAPEAKPGVVNASVRDRHRAMPARPMGQ